LTGAADGLTLAKVIKTGELLENFAHLMTDLKGTTIRAIFEESPKLFDTIQLVFGIVLEDLLLKVVEDVKADAFLERETVKAKETLETIAEITRRILECKSAKLVVHPLIKVISKKV